jgi:alanine racemase
MSYVEINLTNLAHNYALLQDRVGPEAKCAAMVKANAYGLGITEVTRALRQAGCKDFFVAHIDEALSVHKHDVSNIFLLHGLSNVETAQIVYNCGIIPVLNSAEQIEIYNNYARSVEQKLPAVLNFDTGMGRLGLTLKDAENFNADYIKLEYIMSHLACPDEPKHPHNEQQLKALKEIIKLFPNIKVTFANSSAIFLNKNYHFDLVRPGAAIYGINPTPGQPNPMKDVVSINARVVQRRILDEDQYIGYGATKYAKKGSKLLVVEYGYSDGYFRNLDNGGTCYADGHYLNVIGRVSMDMTTIDASVMPENLFNNVQYVEMIGEHIKLDDIARQAGTIGYELLTSLGIRHHRKYIM